MDKAIRAIINVHYDKCVARVVHRLRRYPAKDWDGDDSSMRTLWDHWKRETQEEYSCFHDLIEDMVEDVVRQVVDRLPHEVGALLTLATDELDDLDAEADEPDEPVFNRDAVVRELMQRVTSRACDEPHRREVQRDLDDQSRDRFERDNEINH